MTTPYTEMLNKKTQEQSKKLTPEQSAVMKGAMAAAGVLDYYNKTVKKSNG